MAKIVYDVSITYPNKEPEIIAALEYRGHGETAEHDITESYLTKLEATLERMETGKRGVLRVGGKLFTVSDEALPHVQVIVRSIIQDPTLDGLHNPEGTPVFTETELATAPAVMRSVVATVTKVVK